MRRAEHVGGWQSPKTSVRTLDLFCGGGGSSWGARAAGAEIVCGVDAWDIAARTYAANFGDRTGVNLKLQDGSRLPRYYTKGIDLILASPECRNHTCAKGNRELDEESRRTARYVLDFVQILEPRWIILENVVQFRNWDGFDGLVSELEDLGYSVCRQTLDAVDFGVPQKRRRLFVVCDRESVVTEIAGKAKGHRSVRSHVIMWDEPWASTPLYSARRADATIDKAERAMGELGRGEPFLVVYYGSDGGGGWQSIDLPLRTLTTIDRFGLVTWNRRTPMLRMLQPPEIRKAMGFDGRYVLPYGSRRDRIKLLGNAVCPPVMQAVVTSVTHGMTAMGSQVA